MLDSLDQHLLSTQSYHALPNLQVPSLEELTYPERVIQFGSGAFLRGFSDFFVSQANRQGVFRGRVVIVNNTRSGRGALFNDQEGLFTLCSEGFANGQVQKDYFINAAVSRALPAADHWPKILECAANPDISIVLSNTTEVGISLHEDDDLTAHPPSSFPGKLTAYLYERFQKLGSTAETGMVILPAELIIDNGSTLRDIVLRLAEINRLGPAFIAWVSTHTTFCNTLVDRIIPGEPDEEKRKATEEELGYQDGLLTVSEVYRFFAIEGNQKLLYERVPFLKADSSIVIDKDITPYRERKLRVLNGGHTISIAAGFLSGLETVHDCMENEVLSSFIRRVIHEEIVPSLDLDPTMVKKFANDVLDRFRNPFLNHQLLSITLQYTSKMNMRNGLTFQRYYNSFGKAPEGMCAGFAAYLLFTRPVRKEETTYYGEFQGRSYPIRDDQAEYFYQQWQEVDLSDERGLADFVRGVLGNDSLWDQDLLHLGNFRERVTHYLTRFTQQGVKDTLRELLQ